MYMASEMKTITLRPCSRCSLDDKTSWFVCICSSSASVFCFGTFYTYGIFFPFILEEFQAGKAYTGFGSSLIYFAGFLIVPLYFDRHRSLATGIVSAGPGTCLLVMTPIVQNLLEHFDWRQAMKILGALNLAPCILGWSIKRRIRKIQNTPNNETKCSKCATIVDFSVLRQPLFLLLSFIGFIVSLPKSMPPVFLIKMANDYGIPSSESSWMYFINGVCLTVSRFIAGRLCDTGLFSLLHVFQCGVLITAIANLLFPLTNKRLEFLFSYACAIGLGEGAYFTAMYCNILKLFAQNHGLGWFLVLICIGNLTGAPTAGLIVDLSGSYETVFYTSGALLFLGASMPFLCRFLKTPDNKSSLYECSTDSELEIFERETVV